MYGNKAVANVTVSVDNSQGANDPKDTRDAVENALTQSKWVVEAVGDTKLKIKDWRKLGVMGQLLDDTDIRKITVEVTGLKDNQKPTYSLTRVAPPAGTTMSSSVGGTWTFGFDANDDATALQDDVQMTIRLTGAIGTDTVLVTLTAGMSPSDAAQEVADQLTLAGYTSYLDGTTVRYDDPDGTLDSVEIEYTTLGTSPIVNWLTESVGFDPFVPADPEPPAPIE